MSGPYRLVDARWYELRPSRSRVPKTYTCPFCLRKLPALSEHVLIRPEGTGDGRRHAHMACVRKERARGRLPSYGEWKGARKRQWLRRLWRRLRGTRG